MTTAGETKVYHVAGFVFTADFDSGNLGGVALEEEREGEEVGEEEEEGRGELITPTLRPSTSTLQVRILT
jgi:hypothetical protein